MCIPRESLFWFYLSTSTIKFRYLNLHQWHPLLLFRSPHTWLKTRCARSLSSFVGGHTTPSSFSLVSTLPVHFPLKVLSSLYPSLPPWPIGWRRLCVSFYSYCNPTRYFSGDHWDVSQRTRFLPVLDNRPHQVFSHPLLFFLVTTTLQVLFPPLFCPTIDPLLHQFSPK